MPICRNSDSQFSNSPRRNPRWSDRCIIQTLSRARAAAGCTSLHPRKSCPRRKHRIAPNSPAANRCHATVGNSPTHPCAPNLLHRGPAHPRLFGPSSGCSNASRPWFGMQGRLDDRLHPSPPRSTAWAPGPHGPRPAWPAPFRRIASATPAPSPPSLPNSPRSGCWPHRQPPSTAPAPAASVDAEPHDLGDLLAHRQAGRRSHGSCAAAPWRSPPSRFAGPSPRGPATRRYTGCVPACSAGCRA